MSRASATTAAAASKAPSNAPPIRLYEAEDIPEGTKPPNTLRITVIRARGVAMAALRSTTSLYCKLSCGGFEHKTKLKAKTLDPTWNETFSFRSPDLLTTCTITVADKVNIKKRFVGHVRIVASDIAQEPMMRCTRMFPLLDKAWEAREKPLGELELKVSLVYEREHDAVMLHSKGVAAEDRGMGDGGDAVVVWDTGDGEGVAVQQDETEEEALLRKQELEWQEKQRQEAIMSNIPKGDYQIQAHIIEARDIKGEFFDGTSDPICYVEVLDKRQKTHAKFKALSCVFDEIMFFHFHGIGRDELETATINVSLYDRNIVRPNTIIGTYQFDVMSIYCRPKREMYRQWVALVDYKNKDDSGIQGFLLLSLAMVGPGESFPVHDTTTTSAVDLTLVESPSMLLLPPAVEQHVHFLVVTVYVAEDVPPMDGHIVSSSGIGIDGFVRVDFAGNRKCKSSVVTVKGTSNLTVPFYEELWIPVMMPTMSRRISLSLRDREFGRSSDVVGTVTYDFRSVPEVHHDMADSSNLVYLRDVPLRYINLYGPPIKHVDAKASEIMKKYPDHASTYRGRVLVSFAHVTKPNPDDSDRFFVREVEDEDWEALKPPTTRYVLRVSLLAGQDLPTVRSKTGLPVRLFVVVSIGPHEMRFEANTAKHGNIVWGLTQEVKNIVLASDFTQVPDIIVTLCKDTAETDDPVGVSFARLRAGEIVAKGMEPGVSWLHLREEICRKGNIPVGQYPGSLLMRVALGREEVAARQVWANDASSVTTTIPALVRVHVFQCKGLVIDNLKSKGALPDPFVQVHFNGVVKKTKPRNRTLDPLYYESLQFETTIPAQTEYAGEVWLQVVNKVGYNNVKYMGEYRVPLSKCSKASTVPYPSWVNLTKTDMVEEAVPAGQLLVSVQFIEHPTAEDRSATLPSIVPECREAYVDIIALGVRNLKSNNLMHIQNPFVEFELTGLNSSGENIQRRTKASHEPTSKNANFLERLVIPTRLPIDVLFAPQLVLKVYDSTLAGLHQPLIASCVIDLTHKLPWSPSYEPPQQQEFDYHLDLAKQRSKKKRAKQLKDTLETAVGAPADIEKDATSEDATKSESPHGEDEASHPPRHRVADSDEEDDDVKINEVSPPAIHDDDGTGIGVLALPPVSFEASVESKEDPAVLQQVKQEEDRRLFASVEDAKKKGQVYYISDPNAMSSSVQNAEEVHAVDSPAYYTGRDWWLKAHGEELEDFLKTAPFESYPLFRAHTMIPSFFRKKKTKVQVQTGIFKGLVAVTLKPQKTNPLIDFVSLTDPQPYEVRVYVLRATNLQPKDRNGLSDPYLRLTLGKTRFNDRLAYKKKTLNPDFYKCYVFDTTIPGPSQLAIQVWDYDRIGTDDFIGETIIDLEDRWYHRAWQDIGFKHPQLDGSGTLKPIEHRHLWTGKESTSQGSLQLWVDILTPAQAALYEVVNIEPPPPQKFEVRVVIWRSEGVTDRDMNTMNDLFVKVWMEGMKPQTTDTHWRCSTGKGSWNYRLKFVVQMPMKPEFGRLTIQLWDKDLAKWNDLIGEAQLDLYKWIYKSFHERRTVRPFKEQNAGKGGYMGENGGEAVMEDEEDDDDGGDNGPDLENNEQHTPLLDGDHKAKKKTKLGGKIKHNLDKVLKKVKRSKDTLTPEERQRRRAEKESNEKDEAFQSILDMLGMGRLSDDSEWLEMRYTNREAGISESMGRLGVCIHIVPEVEFLATPVGSGRDEPNINPYLPPTVGRIRFSANPFSMLKELLGPELCGKLACFLCCAGCLSFMALFGASIMSTLTFYQQLQNSKDKS
ncbi:hypothetical protein H310_03043 [Aphanomyces invadans]|uniref:C2 domain-containing protein n=1 Tax=Aphanomyces invadans TaxID=157072 RepID=A0A024UM75_9STRA|nr:hypothetical protein H310_03043 [Aphanomyces invadans]ETW06932.1 hypothetical protein H310_03043 [Aphanomyces invadans]|eukprot:XP_008865007.1 hypothetical protein H310_03043 [Aphanomyces invadans]